MYVHHNYTELNHKIPFPDLPAIFTTLISQKAQSSQEMTRKDKEYIKNILTSSLLQKEVKFILLN